MNPEIRAQFFRIHFYFFMLVLSAGLVGYGLHCFNLFINIAIVYYCSVNLYKTLQLKRWVDLNLSELEIPDSVGMPWDEIYNKLSAKNNDYKKQIQQLNYIIDRARSSVEALEEGVVLIDAAGNLEWWNPSATRLLQLNLNDKNKHVTNFIRDPRFVQYFKNGNYTEPLNIPSFFNPDQQLQFEITIFGENDRLMICWDTTLLKNLENMRKEFVANVSHELKTPLTVFFGYLETLVEHKEEISTRWNKAILNMHAQALRMTHIVNDLLILSRLESTVQKSKDLVIDMPSLIGEIYNDALIYGADRHQKIEMEIDQTLLLFGNFEDIRSAFMNLVTNAIKYSPDKSTIRISWYQTKSKAVFQVSDQGVGIEASHIPRLTERFYRIDPSRSKRLGGTGLGLAIVKHVLLKHQGQLHIESTPNKGSDFQVSFNLERIIYKEKC